MSQPSESQGRGRKPANEWSYKTTELKDKKGRITTPSRTVKVKIAVPAISTFTKAEQAEFAELGLRQAARQTFQAQMKELETKISTNIDLVKLAKSTFPAGEKLDVFLKGVASRFPSSWTYGGEMDFSEPEGEEITEDSATEETAE